MLGTKTLHDILVDRETIVNHMEAQLDSGSTPWGMKIERVEMYVSFAILIVNIFLFQYGCSFTTINATINGC
jgi:hypothetical protein